MVPRSRSHSTSPETQESDRSVQFDSILLIEFLPALGDNPSVSAGVPITLSQKPVSSRKLDVDRYEQSRRPRRKLHDLVIERDAREKM